jgi:D-glycero-alpha-D-manno-heptose-7-phosphate kinase
VKRDASDILKVQREATREKFDVLRQMRDLVPRLNEVFSRCDHNTEEFGQILHDGWMLKRSLTSLISNPDIDRLYDRAVDAGALGGKLLGAGSGGFLLFYVPEEKQSDVKAALAGLYHQPFRFDDPGTRITYYDER